MESYAYLDNLDDPIALFDREIRLIIKSPSTSQNDPDRQLLSVLHRCIRYIQRQERYRNDPRYLRIWLMYASYYSDPMHVFNYLKRAEIGKYLSAFYYHYSSLLEQSGRIAEAITTLRAGIDAQAQPLNRLQSRIGSLQKKYACNQFTCTEKAHNQPDDQRNPDASIFMKLPHDDRKYGFPVALDIHDNAAKRCQLIIEAKLFDIQTGSRHTDNEVPLETIHSAKRKRPKYVKDILKDEQLLSFEEVRANHARGHLKSAIVENLWHEGHVDDRESAKNNSSLKSNQTEHCMSNTICNIDPVQPTITEYVVKSPYAPERSQGGPRTLPQVSREGSGQSINQHRKHFSKVLVSSEKQTPGIQDGERISNALTEFGPAQLTANVRHTIPSIPPCAIQISTQFYERIVRLLKTSLQVDGVYYESIEKQIPLKGSLVRLLHRKSTRFVPFILQITPYSLSIVESLAQGGHARVFKAKNMNNIACAVKVQLPPHTYEYCMLKRTIAALGPNASRYVVRPTSFHHFQNASCLVMEYCPQGTLLAAVNKIKLANCQTTSTATSGLTEPLAMFLTIRLLNCVAAIHLSGFIHGDIKPDNVMLNLEKLKSQISGTHASNVYTGHDDEYWALKQIKMIDFGRAIDLNLFPSGQKFIAGWNTNLNDDPPQALRHGEWEPWVLDYWGTAKVIYCLLFGQHMQVIPAGGQWVIKQPLKRWWHTPIWNKTFNILLNPTQDLPMTSLLQDIRKEMQTYLTERDGITQKWLSNMITELENVLE